MLARLLRKMANTRKEISVVGIGGSVLPDIKAKIYAWANKEGISPSALVGRILTEWVEGKPNIFS